MRVQWPAIVHDFAAKLGNLVVSRRNCAAADTGLSPSRRRVVATLGRYSCVLCIKPCETDLRAEARLAINAGIGAFTKCLQSAFSGVVLAVCGGSPEALVET